MSGPEFPRPPVRLIVRSQIEEAAKVGDVLISVRLSMHALLAADRAEPRGRRVVEPGVIAPTDPGDVAVGTDQHRDGAVKVQQHRVRLVQ